METQTDLIADLFRVVGRFRRQLRRSTGRGFDAAGLTEAQAELLRLVGRRPGVSVREAADELGLVANTASTLVSSLAADGLLIRGDDTDDRRVCRLRLSDSAQQVVDKSRASGRAVLAELLAEFDDAQLDALSSGLAVMEELTAMLGDREQ